MSRPEISVIVPLYQVAGYAAAAVESLLGQSFPDFEALLIDDGSCDGSGQIALQAAQGDPRFRLITQGNLGLSAARNRGLAEARGRYIAFLDGDDRFAPQFLGQMRAALTASEAPWVACGVQDVWPSGAGEAHPAIFDAALADLSGQGLQVFEFSQFSAIFRHYPSAWNKLYRQDLIADLRFHEGTWFEDHAFYLQLALRAGKMAYLPEVLYLQTRGREGQITASDDDRIFQQFPVLDQLSKLMQASDLGQEDPEATRAAFAALAGRLLSERVPALRDSARRQLWLQAARQWLAGQGITMPTDLAPSLAAALRAEMPIAVVIETEGHDPAPQGALLAALASQDVPAFEIVVVSQTDQQGALWQKHLQNLCPDRPVHIVPAHAERIGGWQAALGASAAQAFVFLRAQDSLAEIALRLWADALGQDRPEMPPVGMVASAFFSPFEGGWQSGWADMGLMRLANEGALSDEGLFKAAQGGAVLYPRSDLCGVYPLLAAKAISRSALEAVLPSLRGQAAKVLPEWALLGALTAAGYGVIWCDFPGARPGPRGTPPLDLGPALSELTPAGAGMGRRLWLRAARMALDLSYDRGALRGRAAAFWYLLRLRRHMPQRLRQEDGPLDLASTGWILRILGGKGTSGLGG